MDRDRGVIFNIQRFSLHDGPGLRDLVFMKGCPLRCSWCSNPESVNRHPEIAYNAARCIGCERCRNACGIGAITALPDGKMTIDRKVCTDCGDCARACPSRAMRILGEHHSTDDVARRVEEDGQFYWRSGGGVTISGGEPMIQSAFVSGLLEKCRERGIHTAVETCGHARWEDVERVCAHANLIVFDVKHIDPVRHEALTGVPNTLILENIQKMALRFPALPIIARTPIVPGLTDSEDNIRGISEFLSSVGTVERYDLLPYHRFGEPKYVQLGRSYELSNLRPPSSERMEALKKIVRESAFGRKLLSLAGARDTHDSSH